MKYNEKYDLYIDDDLVIYYWDKKLDKLMQRKLYKDKYGYLIVSTIIGLKKVHRIIYETFVGTISDGYQIDHINTIKDDNRLENLRCVTPKENMNNPLSRKQRSDAKKGKTYSEFGRKFKDHYGISCYQNIKLYNKEQVWYLRHGKCRWEV